MGHWMLRYVPFGGKPRTVAEFASKCDPQTAVLNKDAVLLVTCPTWNSGRGANAIGMDGKPLWSIHADRDFAQERLSASSDGSRVALSRLRLINHVNTWFSPIDDDNFVGQQIEVFDTDTGMLRAVGSASPANGFGHNYALAPDGSRFATLNNHEIEVYNLPPARPPLLSAKEPEQIESSNGSGGDKQQEEANKLIGHCREYSSRVGQAQAKCDRFSLLNKPLG
jgi:hypothetical protein